MSEFDQDHNQSEDNVWTSYSDMFTTMAIIFLVMFVFALIKAGVSTMTITQVKQKQKNELAGKMTAQMRIKHEQDKKILERSVEQIDRYEDSVNKKIVELSSFVKNLKQNKQLIKKVMDETIRKDLAIKTLNQELHKREKLIKEKELLHKQKLEEIAKLEAELQNTNKVFLAKVQSSKKRIDHLQQVLAEHRKIINKRDVDLQKAIQVKQLLEQEVAKVKKTLEQKSVEFEKRDALANRKQQLLIAKIKSIKIQIEQKQEALHQQLSVVQKQSRDLQILQRKNQQLRQMVTQKEQVLGQKTQKLQQVTAQYKQTKEQFVSIKRSYQQAQHTINKLNQTVAQVTDQLHQLRMQYRHSKISNNDLRENLSRLAREKQMVERALGQSGQKNERLKKDIAHLQDALNQSKLRSKQIGEVLQKVRGEYANLQGVFSSLEGKYKMAVHQGHSLQQKYERDMSFLKNKLRRRTIASVEATKRANYRGELASKLAAKFRKANLNVRVNPKTGSIILGVGAKFLFEKNSARLSRAAKKTLQKIIPLYATTLLSDAKAAENIASFNIIGHASPTYRGECVDPKQQHSRAYDYNLHLSALRAEAVTRYLFSSKSFSFAKKWVMRNLTNSVGKSFSEPVKYSSRTVANTHGKICYGYDVNNSQRVELSFTLKDNLKIH